MSVRLVGNELFVDGYDLLILQRMAADKNMTREQLVRTLIDLGFIEMLDDQFDETFE